VTHWRIKLSLFLNFLFFSVVMSSDGILILQVQKHYGIAAVVAGILGGCRDLSVAVTALLVSAYVARIGYKRSMLIALTMVALIFAWVPTGNSFNTIELMFVVTGASFALVKSSIFASLGLLAHDIEHHASMMSYLEATFACGTFAGYFIFSSLGDDAEPASKAWLMIYYVLAAVAVLAMLVLWSAPFDESQVHKKAESLQSLLLDFVAMFKLAITAVAAAFVASVFTFDVLNEGIMKWLPTFNNEVLHIPVNLSIQMSSILAGSAVLGRIIVGIAVRFFHWLAVLLVCLGSAAGLVIFGLPLAERVNAVPIVSWQTAPLAVYIFPLIGMVTAPIYPIVNSVMLSSLPPRQHGAMTGLILLSSALGATAGSLVTGKVFEIYGGATAFYWMVIPIFVLVCSLTLLWYLEKKALAGHNPLVESEEEVAAARIETSRPV
jgi:MFS transporter, FHS family, glucose/mannose:H+ symporter